MLQQMLCWRAVLSDRPSQLPRRPALDTSRNPVGAAHVLQYLELDRQLLELLVLLLYVEQNVLRNLILLLTNCVVQRRHRLRS